MKKSPDIYTSRPGLRLWTADINGKVSATLMYKGLTNENPPGITILNPPPPCLTRLPTDYQAQFGPLRLFHGQFFVTWDVSRLWVLDTSPCALVGYHGNMGDIVDVSMSGHEIYILQRGGERLLMKLSLIPKLANPLLDVVALLERSYKSDEEENVKQHELTVENREAKSEAQTSNKVCILIKNFNYINYIVPIQFLFITLSKDPRQQKLLFRWCANGKASSTETKYF